MASSTDFLLALENVSVSFDGFKAVNGLNLYIDKGELRVIIGRRQDHGARPDLRSDEGLGGLDQVQGPGNHRPQGTRDRTSRHRTKIPDSDDLRRPLGVRKSRTLDTARPQRRRRLVLEAHRGGQRAGEGHRRHDLSERPSRSGGGDPQSWTKAVARDRDAADFRTPSC